MSRLFPVYLLSRQKVHHAVFQLAISCCQLTGRNISRFALAIYSSAGDSTNFVHFVLLPIQRGCCVCILYITLAAFLATFLARLVTTLLTTLKPEARKSNARKKARLDTVQPDESSDTNPPPNCVIQPCQGSARVASGVASVFPLEAASSRSGAALHGGPLRGPGRHREQSEHSSRHSSQHSSQDS